MAPLILGIILGDLLDKNLRRSLILSDGGLAPFFNQPIGLVLFIATLLVIFSKMKWFRSLMFSLRQGIVSLFKRKKAG